MPEFTQEWFRTKGVIESFDSFLKPLFIKEKSKRILEIGAFEGMSTLWFLENLPKCHVTVVDNFLGDTQNHEMVGDFKKIKDRFLKNTEEHKKRVYVLEGDSKEVLPKIEGEFDVVYVDGSHRDDYVISDAKNAYRLLKKGGILIFDDYIMEYTDRNGVTYAPKKIIDEFIRSYGVEPIYIAWQMVLRKL